MNDFCSESEGDGLPDEPSIPLESFFEYSGGQQTNHWRVPTEGIRLEKREPMLALFERTWQKYGTNDLLLRLGKSRLRCNRLLLIGFSAYAAEKLANGGKELVLSEDRVPYAGLLGVCAWMSKAHGKIDYAQLMQVMVAATFLRMDSLCRQIWYCLDLPHAVTEEHAFVMAHQANSMKLLMPLPGLETTFLRRIKCFFLTLVASVEFLQLTPDLLCRLLSADVAVNSEREVFFAAVRWLTHDWATRSQFLLPVMDCVRLAQLPYNSLLVLPETTNDPMVNLVITHPDFREVFDRALAVHVFIYFDDGSRIYDSLYRAVNVKKPVWRPFILHKLCRYHKPYTDRSNHNFSYSDFLAYLRCLQIANPKCWKSLKMETQRDGHYFI
ncbi:hypothetical protein KR222_009235 [Zaprionus bogoriensis]|nr:hypothetical protein KR222_009235 [Zaprionus bogoriensis]